jgi:hypothetical protein
MVEHEDRFCFLFWLFCFSLPNLQDWEPTWSDSETSEADQEPKKSDDLTTKIKAPQTKTKRSTKTTALVKYTGSHG